MRLAEECYSTAVRVLAGVLACAVAAAEALGQGALGAHYSNAAFGYIVEYPLGWRIAFFSTEGGARISPPGSEVWMGIRAADVADDLPMERLARAYEEAVASEPPTDLRRIVDVAARQAPPSPPASTAAGAPEAAAPAPPSIRTPVLVAGTVGIELRFTSKPHVALLALHDRVVYALQLNATTNTLPQYEPYFWRLVRSFRFQPRLKRGPV